MGNQNELEEIKTESSKIYTEPFTARSEVSYTHKFGQRITVDLHLERTQLNVMNVRFLKR